MDDAAAINALVARYADLIDAGDFAGIGELFARGRLVDANGTVLAQGADAVTALYLATTRRFEDGTPRTAHLVTNLVVEVDGATGTASARSRFCVLQSVEPGTLRPIITGSYRDTFALLDGAWWFAERCMVPHLVGDLGEHLLFDATALDRRPPAPG